MTFRLQVIALVQNGRLRRHVGRPNELRLPQGPPAAWLIPYTHFFAGLRSTAISLRIW